MHRVGGAWVRRASNGKVCVNHVVRSVCIHGAVQVVGGLLAEHAVIVVTHMVTYAEGADRLLVLDGDGRMVRLDAPDDLQSIERIITPNAAASAAPPPVPVPTAAGARDEVTAREADSVLRVRKSIHGRKASVVQTTEEHRTTGGIATNTYRNYLASVGSAAMVIAVFVLLVGTQVAMVRGDLWPLGHALHCRRCGS